MEMDGNEWYLFTSNTESTWRPVHVLFIPAKKREHGVKARCSDRFC